MSQSLFALSAAIRQVEHIAISEPNQLELVLNSSYAFQRKVIEAPENRSAIQETVARLTGVRPVVVLRLAHHGDEGIRRKSGAPDSVESKSQPATGTALQEKRQIPTTDGSGIDPQQDAFVQEVVKIFNARVERMVNAPAKRSCGTTDESA